MTKRGKCARRELEDHLDAGRNGSAITWKYPGCILQGDHSVGEFYSVATTNNWQQADTGTKMIHLGQEHEEHDRVEGHLGRPRPEHLPRPGEDGEGRVGARNYSQCDSLLIGDLCGAHTFPYLEIKNSTAQVEHEASTSKSARTRSSIAGSAGMSTEDAVN